MENKTRKEYRRDVVAGPPIAIVLLVAYIWLCVILFDPPNWPLVFFGTLVNIFYGNKLARKQLRLTSDDWEEIWQQSISGHIGRKGSLTNLVQQRRLATIFPYIFIAWFGLIAGYGMLAFMSAGVGGAGFWFMLMSTIATGFAFYQTSQLVAFRLDKFIEFATETQTGPTISA